MNKVRKFLLTSLLQFGTFNARKIYIDLVNNSL